jgi:hypothetical protein
MMKPRYPFRPMNKLLNPTSFIVNAKSLDDITGRVAIVVTDAASRWRVSAGVMRPTIPKNTLESYD